MKYYVWGFVTFVLLIAGAISCNNSKSALTPNNQLGDLDAVSRSLNGKKLSGRVLGTTRESDHAQVVLIRVDSSRSSYATYAVICQREQGNAANALSIDIEKAEVIMTPTVLYINSLADGSKYILKVKSDQADEIVARLPDNYKKNVSISEGYGVSYRTGEIPFDLAKYQKLLDQQRNTNARVMGPCKGGGPGSSSCNLGTGSNSCSVTCQAGYYACCNPSLSTIPDCNCVRN